MAMRNAVPDGWRLATIDETCDVLDSKRIPLNSQERALRQGNYPYYGANGVQGYIDDFIFDGEHVLLAEDGGYFDQYDARPISYLVSGKFWVNNHAHILKAKNGHETKYVHYSLVHKNILKHINGGTRSKLNQSDMREIEYLVPPLPEQQKIATILSSVDDVIEKTQAQINKLKDLKTGMMQELLSPREGSKQAEVMGYTEFKDSLVGRIPVGWDVVTIGDCVSRFYQGINTVADKIEYQTSGIRIIQAKHITSGSLNMDDARFMSRTDYEKYRDKFQPEVDDILFSNIGTIGKSVLVDRSDEFLLAWNVFLIRVSQHVSPQFMQYWLQRLDGLNFYDDLMTGNATKFVNKSSLAGIAMPVPSSEEQNEICGSLLSLDHSIAERNKKHASLLMTKKALMEDLLTGNVRVST